MFTTLQDKFYNNFIADERWKYIAEGLGVTLRVTFFAVIIGIVLGFLVAIVRSTYDKTGKLRILNAICKLYLTVIRGTPVVVQLLIIYFVIFGSSDVSKVLVAVMAFGLNSGAYVAEIFRSGIMSVDNGDDEHREKETLKRLWSRDCANGRQGWHDRSDKEGGRTGGRDGQCHCPGTVCE